MQTPRCCADLEVPLEMHHISNPHLALSDAALDSIPGLGVPVGMLREKKIRTRPKGFGSSYRPATSITRGSWPRRTQCARRMKPWLLRCARGRLGGLHRARLKLLMKTPVKRRYVRNRRNGTNSGQIDGAGWNNAERPSFCREHLGDMPTGACTNLNLPNNAYIISRRSAVSRFNEKNRALASIRKLR